MVDRRSFIFGGLGACALELALPRLSLASSPTFLQDQSPAKQPSADEWMSQWMPTPQHGEKKLRGAGQGMLVVARFADPMYIVEGPVSWTPDADEKAGSWQESGKVCVLRGFLKSDEVGSRGGQPLYFQ